MIALQKLWKMFLFHLKSSFRSRNFCISSSPLFLPVSHCFRGWSNVNLIVCDINWLNINLTHFVWYLGKEKRYDIETLPDDRVLNKNIFMEKSCRKCVPKASRRPPFNFGNPNPKQPLHARNSFKSKISWNGIIKNP